MTDQPVGDIVKSIQDDVKLLVQDQIELAKSELLPSAKHAGVTAGMFGGAAYFAINAALLLYVAAALGLVALGVTPWLAFVIVAVVLLVVAGVLGLIGYLQAKKVKAPEQTIAQAQDSVNEISGSIKRATAAAGAPQIEGKVVEVQERQALR